MHRAEYTVWRAALVYLAEVLKDGLAQSLLLRTAARRAHGRVIRLDTLRGGARVKVLTSLVQRGWYRS